MLHEFTDVLGLLYNKKEESLDETVEAMIQARQAARKAKNFAEADRIRDELKAMGITSWTPHRGSSGPRIDRDRPSPSVDDGQVPGLPRCLAFPLGRGGAVAEKKGAYHETTPASPAAGFAADGQPGLGQAAPGCSSRRWTWGR